VNAGTSAVTVKLLKTDRSTSCALFHQQFEAMVDHIDYAACENARHLLVILQGKVQTSYVVSQPQQHTKISLRCRRAFAETTSWQRPIFLNKKPGPRGVVSHYKEISHC
jgi:hypothetical protein